MGRLNTPGGEKYNPEDPLGIIAKEDKIKWRLSNPSALQQFIEAEAIKRDKARKFRLKPPTYEELKLEFEDILKKLFGMVVTAETHKGYIKGRITGFGKGYVEVKQRGNKREWLIDFDEIIRLKKGYD